MDSGVIGETMVQFIEIKLIGGEVWGEICFGENSTNM